jgi:hypothetical protein
MKAIAEDLDTGEKITVDITEDHFEELRTLAEDKVSDSKLDSYIDNLHLSADAKALVASILKASVKVGDLVIRVGKRIVELVVMLVSKFPNATFGLILGLIVGALVTSIPLLGALLGGLVAPIAAIFGLTKGYFEDLKDQNLERKIVEATAMFQSLNGQAHVSK